MLEEGGHINRSRTQAAAAFLYRISNFIQLLDTDILSLIIIKMKRNDHPGKEETRTRSE